MRDITFTGFDDCYDKIGGQFTKTWDDWVTLFSEHTQTGHPEDKTADAAVHNRSKNHSAVILGPTDGTGKEIQNVLAVEALAVDLDSATEDEVAEIMRVLSVYEFVAWTTHKHGADVAKGKPRLRIVLPLESSYPPEDHPTVWYRLNALISYFNDPSTKNINRIHYLPTTYDLSVAETFHNPGPWLRIEDLPVMDAQETVDTVGTPSPPSEFRDVDIEELRATFIGRVRKLPREDTRKKPLLAMLTGKDFSVNGKGHKVLVSCINYLAGYERLTEGQFTALFGESINTRAKQSTSPETLDAVFRDYTTRWEEKYLERRQNAVARQSHLTGTTQYSTEDFKRIGQVQGLATAEELRERWILQHGVSAWFLDGEGHYQGPYQKDDHFLALRKYLGPAVNLLTPGTQNSPPRLKPYMEVAVEHGTLIEEVRADLALQHSSLVLENDRAILHYAVNPMRTDLTPHYDPEIDDWLKRMCGPVYTKVIDWLSVYMDLTKFLCAIYIAGPQGCGKSLFAQGVSKLWTHGPPTELTKVLGQFNAGLRRCPILFGDENIQVRGLQVTAEIRKILGNPARSLEIKYQNPVDLTGQCRVVLAANNDGMLRDDQLKTPDDVEAIALRFLFIQPSPEATQFLRDLPEETKERWGEEGIARHALWLQQNHTIKNRGQRFVVEGDVSTMTTGLVLAEDVPNFVCESLVRYLQAPDKVDVLTPHQILKKSGVLYATSRGVRSAWESYLGKTHLLPETRPIADSLKTISTCRKLVRPPKCDPIRYYEINMEYLIRWSEENGELNGPEVMELLGHDSQARIEGNVIQIHNDGTAPDPSGDDY